MFIDNIPSGYHISKGADSIFYILNDGENFVKNLSTDFETAKIEAKKIVGENVDVSIWTRIYLKKDKGYNVGFEPLQRYALPYGWANNSYDGVFYSHKTFPLFHKSWNSEQIDRTDIGDNVLRFGYDFRKNLEDQEYNSIKNSQWLGTKGKVREPITFTGKIILKRHTKFGSTLYKFDVNGNVVLTFTENELGNLNQVVSIKGNITRKEYGDRNYGDTIKARIKDEDYFDNDNLQDTTFFRKITKINRPKIITEFQADNKIQVSARKSTNNNPELKTKGENDE